MKFEWEEIYNSGDEPLTTYMQFTYRSKVFGGWIVRHEIHGNWKTHHSETEIDVEGYQDKADCMIFIPDQNHAWKIEETR